MKSQGDTQLIQIEYWINTLDQIHFYLYHIYDYGLRLTEKQKIKSFLLLMMNKKMMMVLLTIQNLKK